MEIQAEAPNGITRMGSDSASPMATPPAEGMVEDPFATEWMVNISGTPPG